MLLKKKEIPRKLKLLNPQFKNTKIKGRGLRNKPRKWAWREHMATCTPGSLLSLLLLQLKPFVCPSIVVCPRHWHLPTPNSHTALQHLQWSLLSTGCGPTDSEPVSRPSATGAYFLCRCNTR